MRIVAAVLFSLVSGCFPWHSAYSQSTLVVPHEANVWKRQYLGAARQVWGLELPAWLAAQVGQESGWRDGLTSSANAKGLCQFIPATAAGMEEKYAGLATWGRYSPRWCFYAQSLLMRDLYRDFKPDRDKCNGIRFAGSAYNGGPTMLNREIALCKVDPNCDYEHWSENVGTKNARANWAWRENRGYVSRITRAESTYSASGWGAEYCK